MTSVGIFWFVPLACGRSTLLVDRTPLADAEPYGDMLTHERGHDEFWTYLATLGQAGLLSRGLPLSPLDSEYDDWPRGRVVFDSRRNRYVVYVDGRLHRADFISIIVCAFSITGEQHVVLRDQHYSRSRQIGNPE